MSDAPPPERPNLEEPRQLVVDPRKRKILKWVAIFFVAPSVILFLLVTFFVARTEYMHDEDRCPFDLVEQRTVAAGIDVAEERRSCQPGVEEHRWLVRREGRPDREIGRRRLMEDGYQEYEWSAHMEGDWVHVSLSNAGVEDARYREGPE